MNLLTANPILTASMISWLLAQIIKTILHTIKAKTFIPERIVGAGGMPSSHSALVVAMVIVTGKVCGYDSPMFALAGIMAGVVIYDAMSVRYNAGLHAKELNKMRKVIDDLDDEITQLSGADDDDIEELSEQKDLKEFLGHTPIEVLAGAMLGTIIALIYNVVLL
ncbi:MAG: divergent PAP2 family protein [Ruminococcaceae bacterium]|nr:divergent PAP2 family protein [Oscillospiraceae bacterium]